MTYPRETHASAYRGANCGRDKHHTHRANKTWRRSEIAPFRMEARVVTHSLTWALCRGRVRSLELCAGNCIPTLGDACYAKRGGVLYVRIVCPALSDAACPRVHPCVCRGDITKFNFCSGLEGSSLRVQGPHRTRRQSTAHCKPSSTIAG